ncbi:MAG: divergent PAP2 family protein [Bacilli bacterium]|jgi:acid phosphatase family membrane protein YuiD|nr:divergent PAP2 family protein [Bacilli bacterium]
MMNFLPLIAAIIANIIAQLMKPFTKYYKTKKFNILEVFSSGGFPSSHTSTVAALATSFAMRDGLSSDAFMISFIILLIVGYDAMNVRLYAGKHITVTDQLISDLRDLLGLRLDDPIYFTKLKKIIGHERFEVFGGFILGLIVSLILFILFGGNF